MKFKFNNAEQNNAIPKDNSINENGVQDYLESQHLETRRIEYEYQNYAPPVVEPEPEPMPYQPEIIQSNVVEEEEIATPYEAPQDYFNTGIANDAYIKPVNDNTNSEIENRILGSKLIRKHAKSDLKLKPILALFLNYFTVVLSFSIVGVMLVAFLGMNKITLMAGGLFSIILTIFSIIILPDFVQIFLDLRRNKKYSKMFSNKNRALPLFVLLFLKSLIFTLILLLFPVLSILVAKVLGSGIFTLIIDSLLYLVMLALVIIVAVQYALSELICVDNKGPVQSLKTSRKMMKNNMGRYIKAILPILGWSIVASLVLSLLCALPMMIIGLNQGFNSIAIALLMISLVLISFIFMIPLYSYWFMIKAEFYDNLLKMDMNPIENKFNKTTIIISLSISLILILLSSAILYMLPADTSAEELFSNILPQNISSDEMIETYALGLYLSIPESYEITEESDTDVYYIKDNKYSLHIKLLEEETDFEEEITNYNAEEIQIGEISGYQYYISNSENSITKYGFSFMYNGYKYSIIGDKELDVTRVVESIREVGMMEF